MTYEEKQNSEIYAVLNMLGQEYIEKLPNSVLDGIVSNKSNEYNPVYTRNIPLEEQVDDEIIYIIEQYRYWCWSDAKQQEELFDKLIADEECKEDIWAVSLPEVKLNHIDNLIEIIESTRNELEKWGWDETEDSVKDAIFSEVITKLKNKELILKVTNETDIEILKKHTDVAHIIIEAEISQNGKILVFGSKVLDLLREIEKDKNLILKVIKEDKKYTMEIFTMLSSDTKEKIANELIHEIEDENMVISIWKCCSKENQQKNLDLMDYLLDRFPDSKAKIFTSTNVDIIEENFENLIERDSIAIEVWNKLKNKDEFQRNNSKYFKILLEKYPDKMSDIVYSTDEDVRYENRNIIIEKIKSATDKSEIYNYYCLLLDSKTKNENKELFYYVMQNSRLEDALQIWEWVGNEMEKQILTEEFIKNYLPILEKNILDLPRTLEYMEKATISNTRKMSTYI